MPHDVRGQLLEVGDAVVIRGKVTEVFPNPDYCNVTVQADVPIHEGEGPYFITLNAGQVQKVPSTPEQAP